MADILAINPAKAFWSNFERMEGWITIAHLSMYFMVLGHFFKESIWWERLFKTSLGVATYISLYSVLQYLGFITINQGGVRADATLGNATYLAIYIVLHIFIALIQAYKNVDKKMLSKTFWWFTGSTSFFSLIFLLILARGGFSGDGKILFAGLLISAVAIACFVLAKFRSFTWLYGGLSVFYLFILYLTATRGAAVGLVGGLILATLIISIFAKNEKKLRKVATIALLSIIAIVLVFVSIRNVPSIKGHPLMGRFATISYSEFKDSARFMVWGMALKGFQEKPMLGWGQENFNYVFNKYYDPGMHAQEQWFDRTHNVVFDWLIAGGIFGLLAYLSLYAGALWLLWFRKDNPLSFTEKSMLTGLLAAHFVNNLFVFDNITSYILFFTILAYIHSQTAKPILKFSKVETEISDMNMSRIVLPTGLLILVVFIYSVNYKAYATSSTLIDTLRDKSNPKTFIENFRKTLSYNSLGQSEVRERLIDEVPSIQNSSAPIEFKQEYFELGKLEIDRQLAETPDDTRYQFFASLFYFNYGRLDEALNHAKKAVELSPKKQSILYHLGRVYLARNEPDLALGIIKEAYDLFPENVDALRFYIIVSIYTEDYDLADELISSNYGQSAIADINIAETYLEKGQYQRASLFFDELIKTYPQEIKYYTRYIDVSLANGDKVKAINLLKMVADIDPKYVQDALKYIEQIESGGNITN